MISPPRSEEQQIHEWPVPFEEQQLYKQPASVLEASVP